MADTKVIDAPPAICGEKFSAHSELVCIKPFPHGGGHSFGFPGTVSSEIKEPAPKKHEYLVADKGFFKCCLVYLRDLIGQAAREDWPRYHDGFKTRCPECKIWMELKEGMFHIKFGDGK